MFCIESNHVMQCGYLHVNYNSYKLPCYKIAREIEPYSWHHQQFKCGTYIHNVGCNLMQKKASTSIQI